MVWLSSKLFKNTTNHEKQMQSYAADRDWIDIDRDRTRSMFSLPGADLEHRLVMKSEGFKHLEQNCPSLLSGLLETVALADEKPNLISGHKGVVLSLTLNIGVRPSIAALVKNTYRPYHAGQCENGKTSKSSIFISRLQKPGPAILDSLKLSEQLKEKARESHIEGLPVFHIFSTDKLLWNMNTALPRLRPNNQLLTSQNTSTGKPSTKMV
ncbi:hypothetical protein SASPL_109216 [Salvia splendens]|uniref:Uncharacterized protein n=1 Tax=Salvia splendens TaxID=180675 RepID=A0A8X9A875_SALSN|nr:hypothetical protein SASPL_109216 [Salvia splendens]